MHPARLMDGVPRRGLGVGRWVGRHLSPERTFALSFAGMILGGAVLLDLPISSPAGAIGWVDALFTATSAVCVTGLSTISVSEDLSRVGQGILLGLVQVGGLGILTFSAMFFIILGRGLDTKEQDILRSVFLYAPRRDLADVLKFIFVSTALCEGAGTLVLWVRFCREVPWDEALYLAAFHAISAFNNAGFSLFRDSLVGFQGDAAVNVTVMALIVAGGIGFLALDELYRRVFGNHRRLSVHTRIVLIASAVLIAAGAGLFFLFERDRALSGLPWPDRLWVCLFQSVTARTAGFNTVDIGALANGTILLLVALMFIGASPGSTGGGVKTTSAGLLFMILWSRLKGFEDVHAFNRTIPRDILQRTIALVLASLMFIGFTVSVLVLAEENAGSLAQSRQRLAEYIFEAVSAFGTVGLSMNLTPTLNTPQKLAVILTMFAGRVGVLTLAFSLARNSVRRPFRYAEEGVMVG